MWESIFTFHQKRITMTKSTITKVYNLIILDESGSMESIKQSTINGFNELVQSIRNSAKETSEIKQFVNVFSFNGIKIKEQLELTNAMEAKEISAKTYQPNDNTPLYDAIGFAVNKLRVAIHSETGYKVLVTIITDGEENSSKEYTHAAIAALINELKNRDWVFTYIGANHDVEKVSFSLNITNHMSFQATVEDTAVMYQKNTRSREKFMDKIKRNETNVSENFFDEEDSKVGNR